MTPVDDDNNSLSEDLETKIFLTRIRIQELREYCDVDIPTDYLLQSESDKCDTIERLLKNTPSNITNQTLTDLVILRDKVVAIGMVINPTANSKQKMESLVLLCNTLEKTPKEQQDSATALHLAQFIYKNTRQLFDQELTNMSDNDLKQDMKTLSGLCDNLNEKIQNNPIQMANLSKQLLLAIKAHQDPSQINTLKQEIKHHKLSISERLYAAAYHKIHKTLYEYLNRLSIRMFNKGYFNRPPYHLRVKKKNKPTFAHKESGVQLFKKPKLHKQLNKIAQHLEKKRKTSSR